MAAEASAYVVGTREMRAGESRGARQSQYPLRIRTTIPIPKISYTAVHCGRRACDYLLLATSGSTYSLEASRRVGVGEAFTSSCSTYLQVYTIRSVLPPLPLSCLLCLIFLFYVLQQ
jgi:hypothetical protein